MTRWIFSALPRGVAIAPGLLAMACAACASGPSQTEIVTIPADALVRVEGYGECQSPCVVELDAPRTITIAKAGYRAQQIEIRPGESKVTIPLELAAPTKAVEETEIPDLD